MCCYWMVAESLGEVGRVLICAVLIARQFTTIIKDTECCRGETDVKSFEEVDVVMEGNKY